MLRVFTVMLALLLTTGCATRMYSEPRGENAAVLAVDNQLSAPASQGGGWQMPMAQSETKAEIFMVDGRRVAEQGGGEVVRVSPGLRAIQVFADLQGVLRFGDFEYEFDRAGQYLVRISADGDKDYRLQLVNESNPGKVLLQEDF